MRTTVDLPPAVHRRAKEIAEERHESLSSVVGELALRGLASLDEPVRFTMSPKTGLPVFTLGRRITSADVADAIEE